MFKVYKVCMFPLFSYSSRQKNVQVYKYATCLLKWTDKNYPEEELKNKLGYITGLLFLFWAPFWPSPINKQADLFSLLANSYGFQ